MGTSLGKAMYQKRSFYFERSYFPEIKLAYFNMAKKFHPDTNKTLDARQVFALIAEAYDVLSDEARRSR